MIKRWLCLLLFFQAQQALCQPTGPALLSTAPLQPLKTGDTVPDLLLSSLLYLPDTSVPLSYFKGRLLILDFMATSCKSCLEELPRLDSLQRAFSGRLQILLVTREPRDKVQQFFSRNKVARTVRLPVVTGDSTLHALFPHRFMPHEVWIGPEGIVRAITTPEYVQAANISRLLQGEAVSWPVKEDAPDFDYSLPLLAPPPQQDVQPARPPFYTTVTPYLEGVLRRSAAGADTAGGYTRHYSINFSLPELYRQALGLPPTFPISRILLEVRDTARFFYTKGVYRDQWKRQNLFCYEAVVPLGLGSQAVQAKMKADLDFYFRLYGRLEKRTIPCWVVTDCKPSGTSRPRQGPDPGNRHFTLSHLLERLNGSHRSQPFLDETTRSTPYYLPLDLLENLSPDALQPKLRPYGLELTRQRREVELLVITEL